MAVNANASYTPSVQTYTQTAGGTAQLLSAGNPQRQGFFLQPITEVIYVNFGATAGIQATGAITFGANATNTETIAVNGITFTFVTGASTTTNVHIGSTKEDTAANLAAVLTASANAAITKATYSNTAATAIVNITYVYGGVDGNAYTLADSSGGHATRSAATLTGGLDTLGGISLSPTLGQSLSFSAADYPSIRNDIWVVSATDASKSVYLESFGS